MVYVTGYTHIPIDIHKLSTTMFPEQKQLTRDDYVIICGDFGGVWDNSKSDMYWRKWLEDKQFTTLFVDSNHENFPLLYQFPDREFAGGTVREIMPHVLHLKRGEIYHLNGRSFFCFGGASSHDKHLRREGVDWWPEELPSMAEMDYAIGNLDSVHWNVDYIITHCAPKKIQTQIADWYENDAATSFLQMVEENCSFRHWYFGHYHQDLDVGSRHTAIYQSVMPI